MKCIICKRELVSIIETGDPVSGAWREGAVHEFICGYGSKHDTDRFVIGICDDCLDQLIKEEVI